MSNPVVDFLTAILTGDFEKACEGEPIRLECMDGKTRVFPRKMIQNVIDGHLDLRKVDGWPHIIRPILAEWLELKSKQSQ